MAVAESRVVRLTTPAICESAELWNAQADRLPVVQVAIDSLSTENSPRISGENEEHVRQLAQSVSPLPPIIVQRTTLRVIDGVHRVRAARLNGQTHIDVQFFDGDDKEAFLLAVERNAHHGLPLTRADRNAAALRIIRSHPDWSDRMIAATTGLSPKTVGSIRRRSSDALPQLNARIGRDGRSRLVDNTERRRLAGEYALAHPNATLREIARESGLSLATARDVRDRIRKGADLTLPKRQQPEQAPRKTTENSPHRVAALTLPETLLLLKRDPSVRLTEHGRFLLRLLDTHALANSRWEELVDQVPPHCAANVAAAARECAASWRQAAQQLEERARAADAHTRSEFHRPRRLTAASDGFTRTPHTAESRPS
ncbi:ParB N-terminal domain-containing protein [Streptomyces sp. ALI-76-A]|jgi:ParB-like chromosome segregation protein Spo0J|uniref:ParB/RepB/Spo0J family partition protein n=1 Tax=Streptomyces sp. ALI-76-A TaxID=3025736 RepID=UPI00256F3CC5|nr:ParB N-terminal domain-containing protein [Streptomyces sp. ALI-76-A]MDL5206209.1 ParB N-terminal domain-containing protein [Streptomyces sp. ALI-76-A]